MPHWSITFQSPATLGFALALVCLTVAIAFFRGVRFARQSTIFVISGLLLLALAAGRAVLNTAPPTRIAVMVDVSSSTRTARYHTPEAIEQRLDELLGGANYSLYAFADQNAATELSRLPGEIGSSQTVFDPPPADAVVLFSDGRFAPPKSSPPVFAVVDPALDEVVDLAIKRLEVRDDTVAVTVHNPLDASRTLKLAHATPATRPAPPGDTVITATLEPGAIEVSAELPHIDPWPEDDSLAALIPGKTLIERWWVTPDGSPAAPAGWNAFNANDLPADGISYLQAGVIALVNVPADAISRLAHSRIEQHVRDAGAGLLILGGDRAFAAGSYAGSALERLSPLASNPPTPTTRWIILIDCSGSMADAIGDTSQWNFATTAALGLIRTLPPPDLLTIGDFSRDVHWWTTDATVSAIDLRRLIPANTAPNGPTNIEAVLKELVRVASNATPTQVLIVTDGDTPFEHADDLIKSLAAQRVRVSVLSHDPLRANNPLKRLVQQTGGTDLAAENPRIWTSSMRHLLREAAPLYLRTQPLSVRFTPAGPNLPTQSAAPWNRTWLKSDATELAVGSDGSNRVPAVGGWNIGAGAVIACAFPPSTETIDALADAVALPPRDPRFTITWDAGPRLKVSIDAIDQGKFLNELEPRLALFGDIAGEASWPIPQTAPGHYEVAVDAFANGTITRILLDGKIIDRIGVAGRYAPEFSELGNDRAALQALVNKVGGQLVLPDQVTPLTLPSRPGRSRPLTTLLAGLGAILLATALVHWKLNPPG